MNTGFANNFRKGLESPMSSCQEVAEALSDGGERTLFARLHAAGALRRGQKPRYNMRETAINKPTAERRKRALQTFLSRFGSDKDAHWAHLPDELETRLPQYRHFTQNDMNFMD
jgi:hypothetical protein